MHWRKIAVLAIGLVLTALSVFQLESAQSGVEIRDIPGGTTPITLYQTTDTGPLVIISHGFAGSRQFMESLSLTLARGGFRVAAFDYQGHGRNPVPMSGDVTSIEGTSARLVDETRAVIASARSETGWDGPIGLVGHSMASDIVIRTALADRSVATVVAISMFSEAVTPEDPGNLLIVTGQWEPYLRRVALDALTQVDASAEEGDTASTPEVLRRAVVAPFVEHVGVLYSPATLRETRAWLSANFGFVPTGLFSVTGPWIALMMSSVVLLAWPLAALVGRRQLPPPALTPRRFAVVLIVPTLVAPFAAALVTISVLPVMVAESLAIMLLIYGLFQLVLLRAFGIRFGRLHIAALALLLAWGIGVFGVLLDRYVASFMPIPARVPVILALAIGTVPFMLADALLTQAGQAAIWRRLAARAAIFAALSIAVALDPDRLFFLVIIFPILILFFIVHGLMGRWIGQHGGALAAGLGLGLILAWALGVSFPLFVPDA